MFKILLVFTDIKIYIDEEQKVIHNKVCQFLS